MHSMAFHQRSPACHRPSRRAPSTSVDPRVTLAERSPTLTRLHVTVHGRRATVEGLHVTVAGLDVTSGSFPSAVASLTTRLESFPCGEPPRHRPSVPCAMPSRPYARQ
jgi:hypothetical protein